MIKSSLFYKTFNNKKVLITGHTGFKGSWLASWLSLMGANITGIGLDPITSPSHFDQVSLDENITDIRVDIRNCEQINTIINDIKPDFIFHLAAQALVKESFNNPRYTWETNVIGTINLLDACRNLTDQCTVVLITSDKCYKNVEWLWGYRETDILGGSDPYSGSKAATELAIYSYLKSYFNNSSKVKIAIGRAGNVIGGGDWSQDRIIPDIIRAWDKKQEVEIRNPLSTRPWQHVLEPLSGYLSLAVSLNEDAKLHGEPFNFGPNDNSNYTVLDVVNTMSNYWKDGKWVNTSDQSSNYESGLLKLNCDKALELLKWNAVLTFDETIKFTVNWYKDYHENKLTTKVITTTQIIEYEKIAKERKLNWAQGN